MSALGSTVNPVAVSAAYPAATGVSQTALPGAARLGLREARTRLTTARAQLRLLGPEQVLGRGYSMTLDATTGEILRDAADVKPAQKLKTRLKKGVLISHVERADWRQVAGTTPRQYGRIPGRRCGNDPNQ
jgi:exonuclease VII large subunit